MWNSDLSGWPALYLEILNTGGEKDGTAMSRSGDNGNWKYIALGEADSHTPTPFWKLSSALRSLELSPPCVPYVYVTLTHRILPGVLFFFSLFIYSLTELYPHTRRYQPERECTGKQWRLHLRRFFSAVKLHLRGTRTRGQGQKRWLTGYSQR